MHTAEFTLNFSSPAAANVIHDAVAVESDEGPEGTTMRMAVDGAAMTVNLEGADASSLRAAMHSALRLLDAAERTAAVGRNG